MNWERVHFVYYVYTSITVIFTLLALGKFFCVGKLYEVYDNINKAIDGGLGFLIPLALVINVLAIIALMFVWKVMIFIFLILMTLAILIFFVFSIILSIAPIIQYLHNYHKNLKRKKNIR